MPRCPRCLGNDITEIGIDVELDNEIKFFSCRFCEEKWWERDGGAIRLEEVIDLATVADRRK